MSKRVKIFLTIFILVGLAVFFMYGEASGDWGWAIPLGIIGGAVVAIIISAAVPFIKKQKQNEENS